MKESEITSKIGTDSDTENTLTAVRGERVRGLGDTGEGIKKKSL